MPDVVTVLPDGRCELNGEFVSLESLASRLGERGDRRSRVDVEADPRMPAHVLRPVLQVIVEERMSVWLRSHPLTPPVPIPLTWDHGCLSLVYISGTYVHDEHSSPVPERLWIEVRPEGRGRVVPVNWYEGPHNAEFMGEHVPTAAENEVSRIRPPWSSEEVRELHARYPDALFEVHAAVGHSVADLVEALRVVREGAGPYSVCGIAIASDPASTSRPR